MIVELAAMPLRSEADVFVARQRAREAAAATGLDTNDQVRVATAVSELGRAIVASGHGATLTVGLRQQADPELVVEVRSEDAFAAHDVTAGVALGAGRRLMDTLTVLSELPFAVTMSKRLPQRGTALAGLDLGRLHDELARMGPASPSDELRAQNLELIATLDQLTAKQDELVRLNAELAETNQGVMAMYSQLSSELEETNRGVVALYAELDERGLQLRDANAAKSRFLASVSHELRSPLNSVVGLARLLRDPDSVPLTEEQAHQVGLIEGSAGQLLGLVNGLLDLAKAESGRLEPHLGAVDLSEMFAELRATMRPLAAPGVELSVDVWPSGIELVTDPTLLAQILRNLISNALKFTESGEVALRAAPAPDGWLDIRVSDTGIGIAPEHQALVFEEFYQVRGPLQTRFRSTGLGLAYSRRLAEVLGGSLDLVSHPGVGSTFTLQLPLGSPPAPEASSSTRLSTVLLIDDDAGARAILRGLLTGLADNVIETDAGETALGLMQAHRPDLVLLDLLMPGLDGAAVIDEVTGDQSLREIPIVVVTSADTNDPAIARLPPATPILDKDGLVRSRLLAAIDKAMRGR